MRVTFRPGRHRCRPRAPVEEGGPVGLSDGGEPTGQVPSGAEGGFRPLRDCNLIYCVHINIGPER